MHAEATLLRILDDLKIGAAIVNGDGQIGTSNGTYASSLKDLGWDGYDNVARLQASTQTLAKYNLHTEGHWTRVIESEAGAPVVLQFFDYACKVLLVFSLAHHPTPRRSTLRRLFGLSMAESNVAQLISAGLTVTQIAQQTRTTEHTVRAHLKHIFQKTHTSTQGSLAHMLRRCSLMPCLANATEVAPQPG